MQQVIQVLVRRTGAVGEHGCRTHTGLDLAGFVVVWSTSIQHPARSSRHRGHRARPPLPLQIPRRTSGHPLSRAGLDRAVPAEYRWIELSDGRVTVYGVCPPDPFQRCRIEHRLACSAQRLPDLWPWLTMLRAENGRRAERQLQADPEPPELPEEWPDAG
ncbi:MULTISPECIES: DUF6083 domain-containing protein [unclassified Streptomyces]|uniref:DUF6083 domain-containing protein n=1 Tax=unclassified Streptomyces TaxID=2593676 RepID=UPI003D8A62C3